MIDHPLYPLVRKLRPEIDKFNEVARLQAFAEVLSVLYLAPFAVIGVIWLIFTSADSVFYGYPFLLLILAVGLLIMNHQTAIIFLEIGGRKKLALSSSLGSVLYWTGVLIWGPVVLWTSLLIDLVTSIQSSIRSKRTHGDVLWGPFSSFLQSLAPLPGILLALRIYTFWGGTYPFAASTGWDWLPILVAITISSIFPSLVMLPIFIFITRLSGSKSNLSAILRFIISAVAFNLIPAPFGIPVAILLVKAGTLPFIAMLLGVVLVNSMAHHLSLTNQRNMQQSKEMSELEKLGEEILKSHPNGSQLTEVLQNRLASMFSNTLDIVVVRFFDNVILPGYTGVYALPHIVQPQDGPIPVNSVWDTLRQNESHFLVLKDQIPTGFTTVYGDAVLVKINSAAPTSDGENPICIGGIYLLMNKNTARTIDSLDTTLALASQIASALYRVQIYQESLLAERMTQELEFAGKIQASLLPDSVPDLDGWSLAAALIPARQTSGDFYDIFHLGKNKLGLLIADVADKGVGAALYMALSRTLLRTFAHQYPDSPSEVFRLVNDRLFEDSRADEFVTVFYGILDLDSGKFEYSNAGHNPTFLLRSDNGNEPENLRLTGMALGGMEEMIWTSNSLMLNKNDILVFYTDGITEAQNEQEEFFGEDRLLQHVMEQKASSSKGIHAHLLQELQAFVGNATQSDDITLLIVKRQ